MGHFEKICRTGRPKGAKNKALETSKGETDIKLVKFAFAAFTVESQPTTDKNAYSDEKASSELSSQAPPTVKNPKTADGAGLAMEPLSTTNKDTSSDEEDPSEPNPGPARCQRLQSS